MKISDLINRFQGELDILYGKEESYAILKVYFEERLQIQISSLQRAAEIDIPKDLINQMETEMMELVKGHPLQYVLGYQWFFGRIFKVNQHVLIPRPETEELVAMIMAENTDSDLKVIDIGTGSGCIPVSLKLEMKEPAVWATDISIEALTTATENAQTHNADVSFINDDILDSTLNHNLRFDIIVSNPPYIPVSHADNLADNVKSYEPGLALFVPDHDPLLFYKAIISFTIKRLSPNGKLYLEINNEYGDQLVSLLENSGFRRIQLRKDLSGNDRFICAAIL